MIRELVDKPKVRKFIDSLPPENRAVKAVRVPAKALAFRRRIYRTERLIFPGLEDAIRERCLILGAGRDQVAIRSEYTAVSPGTEKGYYLDLPNFHQPRPYIPGYSGCGRVIAAGKRVSGLRRGDRVAGVFKHSGVNVIGEQSAVSVPDGVESSDAAFVGLGVIALTGVRAAGLAGGERVGVLGQGILGQMANRMVREEGASGVTALARGDSKREMAEKSGADGFIAVEGFDRPLSSLGFDVVIDSTGSISGFESALEMVRPGGRVVMLGSIAGYGRKSDWARVAVEKGVEIRGAHVRNLAAAGLTYREEAGRFLNLLAEGKLKPARLVTDNYRPDRAVEIYRRLAEDDRNMVGVLIDWR